MSRRRRTERRGRPGVEGLEGRPMLSAIYTTYPMPSSSWQPSLITAGPDGNLWFTVPSSFGPDYNRTPLNAIGMIRPTTGAVTIRPLGLPANSTIQDLVFTPDGNLWFTDPGNGGIGLYNPVTGYLVEFPMPLAGGTPERLALGPDGNVWFTDSVGDAVGEINPTTHAIREYPLPNLSESPNQIVAAPDGNLWFTSGGVRLASIDPTTHAIHEYGASPASDGYVRDITVGPDGAIWCMEDFQLSPSGRYPVYYYDMISFNTNSHSLTDYGKTGGSYSVLSYELPPAAITSGPQGSVWFDFGQVSPTTRAITTDPAPPLTASPYAPNVTYAAIVTGPDGNVWSVRSGQVIRATPIPAGVSYFSGTVADSYATTDLPGQTVFVDLKGDGTLDPGDPSAVTDATGYYTLGPVAPGPYTVRVLPRPGNAAAGMVGASESVTAVAGQNIAAPAFSVRLTSPVLPLTVSPTPFGAHNPDLQTAEVNGLYQLILGRAADGVGGASAVAALKGGTPLLQVVSGLLHSAEYFASVAVADYRSFLGRVPAGAEVKAVVSALQGGLTVEALAAGLLSSAEFNALHPAVADFVQAAYQDTLGRSASAPEVSAVSGLIDGGLSRSAVVDSLVRSTEADQRMVTGIYTVFLDRVTDPTGLGFWVGALQAGVDPLEVAAEFASGAEFEQRANSTIG